MNETGAHKATGDLFCRVSDVFRFLAQTASRILGSAWSFIGALFIIIIWAATGPAFRYSDTWQLIINTGTTIMTFLMVFLIQNTQNRDSKSAQLKLDELIRSLEGARNHLISLDQMSDRELDHLEQEFKRLGKKNQPRTPD